MRSHFDPVELALEPGDPLEWEHALLQQLQREIGFDAAFFAAKGAAPTTVNVDVARLDAALRSTRYVDELAPTKRAAARQGGVAVDTEVVGEREVQRYAYYRDFARPAGGRHSLLGFPRLRGVSMGAVMLGRCDRSFSDAEQRRVAALLPRIAAARGTERPGRAERQSAEIAFEGVPTGVPDRRHPWEGARTGVLSRRYPLEGGSDGCVRPGTPRRKWSDGW